VMVALIDDASEVEPVGSRRSHEEDGNNTNKLPR
jgi:hypothetical protein